MGKENIQKINKPRAIRRLVIWYKRNSAVTSIVDTAASSAATASYVAGNVVSGAGSVVSTASNVASNVAGNVAGNVVSSAESVVNTASSVVSNASTIAKNTLQPLVFDPLKRLQNSDNNINNVEESQSNRIWIAVDGMGGDYAPGPILEGCLEAISRFPINIKFVGKIEKVNNAAKKLGLVELLKKEIEHIGSINPIIIAFGNDCFEILSKLKNEYTIFKVPHYSSRIKKEDLKDEFCKISQIIN